MKGWRALAALTLLAAAPPPADNGAVFDKVWADVQRRYWDPALHGVDWDAARDRFRPQALAAEGGGALYAVLNRMLGLLHDSHVFAIPPSEVRYQASRDAGEAQASFGFASYEQDGGWLVYAVTPGSSAARAGVKAGWRLISIDGRPVDVDRHPSEGERARLVFDDVAGRPRVLDLVAASAPPDEPVRFHRLAGDILLITLDGFDAREDRRIAAELRDGPEPAAVILDLRDNDGGEEETAARVAGLFFAEKHTLLRRIDRRHEDKVPIEGAGRRSFTGPMAVLVGPRSASAAEALAALLSESGRAESVGERTSGALTGASIEDLPDGGQLSLADFDVRTPGGKRIEGVGFLPVHQVRTTPAEMEAGRDPVLAAALHLVAAPSHSARETLHARP
jgi:carboxyl-terminal processing protease